MAQDEVKLFLGDIASQIGAFSGVVASNYARWASIAIVEEWAKILIDGIVNDKFGLADLSPSTVATKMDNPDTLPGHDDTPLLESGRLLSSIEFRIVNVRDKGYNIIEVGITDTDQHGDRSKKSIIEIANIHEFGIGVEPRPFFTKAAEQIGFRQSRIFTKTFDEAKVRLAQGYSKAGVTGLQNREITPNSLELAAKASMKTKGGHRKSVKIGRIIQSGSQFIFKWD